MSDPQARVDFDAPSPAPPASAVAVFGDRLPLAEAFASALCGPGLVRGLLGPREVPGIWPRHLLNCAALTDLLPTGARVVDVGSGAGLPGVVLAIRRPDLRVDLVEPMARRTDFLDATLADLGLEGAVRVVRGRAEDPEVLARVGNAEWVTARAVAPLDRLARWCLPILAPGGTLLAIKGRTAAAELATHQRALDRLGARDPQVISCGGDATGGPVTVVSIRRSPSRQE
ncbi:MAG: rRNA (guanine527-N7)-methyltransferase [Pseudonocardiales bacterium]|nr:rRNA (guanine527-N7)-methyltransferase [Pseudonocardiales bacterium]